MIGNILSLLGIVAFVPLALIAIAFTSLQMTRREYQMEHSPTEGIPATAQDQTIGRPQVLNARRSVQTTIHPPSPHPNEMQGSSEALQGHPATT